MRFRDRTDRRALAARSVGGSLFRVDRCVNLSHFRMRESASKLQASIVCMRLCVCVCARARVLYVCWPLFSLSFATNKTFCGFPKTFENRGRAFLTCLCELPSEPSRPARHPPVHPMEKGSVYYICIYVYYICIYACILILSYFINMYRDRAPELPSSVIHMLCM